MPLARPAYLQRRLMQTGLRAGSAVARHDPRLRRMALRIGDRMVMACALGGPIPLFDAPDLPVLVLVRGGPQVTRYVLYEAAAADASRRRDFIPTDLRAHPLYGGGIHAFQTDNRSHDRAYFVRAHLPNGRSRDSDLIAAPVSSQPTRFARAGLQRDAAGFDWRNINAERWVSFLIVRRFGVEDQAASPAGLLAAVYVFGQGWRYPDLAAAPFHYRGTGAPTPSLPPDAEALYFAVRRDSWVSAFDRLAPGAYSA